jgi:hypothetical protein
VRSNLSRFRENMKAIEYLTENIVISETKELTPEDTCERPIPFMLHFY